jgi:hypothetical protein
VVRARRLALVWLVAAGLSGCSGDRAVAKDGAAGMEGGTATDAMTVSDAGLDAQICDAACSVVRGAGCPDAPEQAACVAGCLDWPIPCSVQARHYGECLVASGSSAFMCDGQGAVLKDGYCDTEGALLDKCVADNLASSERAPTTKARRLFVRRTRHAPDRGS